MENRKTYKIEVTEIELKLILAGLNMAKDVNGEDDFYSQKLAEELRAIFKIAS